MCGNLAFTPNMHILRPIAFYVVYIVALFDQGNKPSKEISMR